MIINIHCHGLKITNDERTQVERRLGFAVGRFSPRVKKVAITFSDVNSVRGGFDKQCRIIAWLDGLEDLFVEDEDASLQALIDRVAERLGRLVGRRIEQQRHRRKRIAYDGSCPASPSCGLEILDCQLI
jgi:ribosome-associated translation inhibitor RaiA